MPGHKPDCHAWNDALEQKRAPGNSHCKRVLPASLSEGNIKGHSLTESERPVGASKAGPWKEPKCLTGYFGGLILQTRNVATQALTKGVSERASM